MSRAPPPGPATWTTKAKQSNTFNGPPGNEVTRLGDDPTVTVTQGGGSLGRFAFDTVPNQAINVPFTVTVTAKDVCGFTLTTYGGGATLSGTLAGAHSYGTFGPWSSGVASASVSASASQTGAKLTATDGAATGTSNAFDVFDAICVSDTDCTANNSTTHVQTHVDSNTPATMSLSLSTPGAAFNCNGSRNAVGSLVTLVPSLYTTNYLVTLRYEKSVAPGTGVANFIVCLGKNGTFTELAPCKNKPNPAPCISSRNRNGVGDLVIVLLLDPADPVGGTYH